MWNPEGATFHSFRKKMEMERKESINENSILWERNIVFCGKGMEKEYFAILKITEITEK